MPVESYQNSLLRYPNPPHRLQQMLNRLRKQFEHFDPTERRVQIARELEKMELTEAERSEVWRRIR